MSLRVHAVKKISTRLAPSFLPHRPLARLTGQSQLRLTVDVHHSYPSHHRAHYHRNSYPTRLHKQSGAGLYTAAVLFGIAIGGAFLFPLVRTSPEQSTRPPASAPEFDLSRLTDSYLVMAPNMPPGRPGTLTPEQEGKLRELWAATMKVFGVYEAPSAEVNGSETLASAATTDSTEKSGKKEKKKSRLNVFKRNKGEKGEKGTDSGSEPPSGTSTPTDLSTLSIADEDDKHGQGKEFKAAIANTAPEDLRQAFWSMVKHDHPDGLLLRFLRARKWDVGKALIMMISTMHWRLEEMHVDDDIILRGELAALADSKSDDPKIKKEGEDFLTQMRLGKSFVHGLDKDGRPMSVVRARLHKQGDQSEEVIERFTVYTIETARMLLRPPVDTATIIFDMTGFSMANMDYAPVKFMIKCFEANYPESLGAILVYKAPWIFNAVWSIIKGWLDPVVAGKVHFAKNVDELEKFVPRSQIPVDLDGDEKWEYTYVEPTEDENAAMKDTEGRDRIQEKRTDLVKRYESTVLDWIHAGDVAENMDERRRERDALAEDLRTNYWTLDPYIRARTLYDRLGLIGEGGKLDFYPAAPKKENVPPVAAAAAVAPPAQTTGPDDLD